MTGAERPSNYATLSLELHNLSVSYAEVPAFSCNQLSAAGSTFAIVGPNGAGKSTLIKTVLNLLEPRRGTLTCSYSLTDTQHTIALRPERDMAFCPENGAVFSDIKVEGYLTFWCRVRRNDGRYYRRGGARYVELLDLERLLQKRGATLSKGERRRVQTCVGFLLNPKLFLFDEPFDGLDVQRSHELVALVQQHTATTFIISSHRMDVVERLADMVLVLDEGEIIANGSPHLAAEKLAGKSICLELTPDQTTPRHSLTIAHDLTHTFPHAIITEHGNSIHLTGSGLSINEVQQLLTQRNIETTHLFEQSPSLVDAMALYLRKRVMRRPSVEVEL